MRCALRCACGSSDRPDGLPARSYEPSFVQATVHLMRIPEYFLLFRSQGSPETNVVQILLDQNPNDLSSHLRPRRIAPQLLQCRNGTSVTGVRRVKLPHLQLETGALFTSLSGLLIGIVGLLLKAVRRVLL